MKQLTKKITTIIGVVAMGVIFFATIVYASSLKKKVTKPTTNDFVCGVSADFEKEHWYVDMRDKMLSLSGFFLGTGISDRLQGRQFLQFKLPRNETISSHVQLCYSKSLKIVLLRSVLYSHEKCSYNLGIINWCVDEVILKYKTNKKTLQKSKYNSQDFIYKGERVNINKKEIIHQKTEKNDRNEIPTTITNGFMILGGDGGLTNNLEYSSGILVGFSGGIISLERSVRGHGGGSFGVYDYDFQKNIISVNKSYGGSYYAGKTYNLEEELISDCSGDSAEIGYDERCKP